MSFNKKITEFFDTQVYLSKESIQHLIEPTLRELANDSYDFYLFESSALSLLEDLYSASSASRKKHSIVLFYIFIYSKLGPFKLSGKLHELMYSTDIIANYFKDEELIGNIDSFLMKEKCVFSSLIDSSCDSVNDNSDMSFDDVSDSSPKAFGDGNVEDMDLNDLLGAFKK